MIFVRAETPADHDDIRRINDEAFGDPIDAKLIDMIRASDRFIPELSLLAVAGGQSIGHVISSYVDVVSVSGRRRVLQVGPLAVLPAQQRQGVGTMLMQETIRIADERGEPLLLIEGSPAYYGRFGFSRADEQGIEAPAEALAAKYFMLRPLSAYDPSLTGRAVYPPETFGGVLQPARPE